MLTNEPLVVKKELVVTVTPQARKVLSQTKYSEEEFLEWALKGQGVSFGGHNVTVFLEYKANANR